MIFQRTQESILQYWKIRFADAPNSITGCIENSKTGRTTCRTLMQILTR